MQVPCPTCKQPIEWSVQNQYRPFCSERCKLLDLGAWADDSYAIPSEDQQAAMPPAASDEDE